MTQRVSKLDAARLLEVSPTTIDRRIQRGELQVEMEPRGTRFRTWVILGDGVSPGRSPDPPGERPSDRPDERSPEQSGERPPERSPEQSGERPPEQSAVDVRVLQERLRSLEELADYHRNQLKDADWRYQELVQSLQSSQRTVEALTRALPAPAPAPDTDTARRGRWWWPFKTSPLASR